MFLDSWKFPFTTVYTTNCPGVCFGYKVSTFFSDSKFLHTAQNLEDSTIGFGAACVNGRENVPF